MHMKYLEENNDNDKEELIFYEDILIKVNRNNILKRYIMLIYLCLFQLLFSIYYIVPTNIVTGGINGIAIILRNIYEFNPSIVMLVHH